jgi:hypothetical protein
MTRPSNREAVQAMFDRLRALDVEGFLDLFAQEGRQFLPYAPEGFPSGFFGRKDLERAYRQLFRDFREVDFPELTIEPMADPERFLALYASAILFADGRRYANRYVALFTVRQGRIHEWVEWFDPIALSRQLGNPFAKEI